MAQTRTTYEHRPQDVEPWTDAAVSDLWNRYRWAWRDSTVDLAALYLDVSAAFHARPTDPAVGMLLDSIRRDLE
jgi:hypothetical protein